jgi:zinc transporter 1/2/3
MECLIHSESRHNMTFRVVAIFIILTTSTIGILTPIILSKRKKVKMDGLTITFFKQFGTGVIISTVFIHVSKPPTEVASC